MYTGYEDFVLFNKTKIRYNYTLTILFKTCSA